MQQQQHSSKKRASATSTKYIFSETRTIIISIDTLNCLFTALKVLCVFKRPYDKLLCRLRFLLRLPFFAYFSLCFYANNFSSSWLIFLVPCDLISRICRLAFCFNPRFPHSHQRLREKVHKF